MEAKVIIIEEGIVYVNKKEAHLRVLAIDDLIDQLSYTSVSEDIQEKIKSGVTGIYPVQQLSFTTEKYKERSNCGEICFCSGLCNRICAVVFFKELAQ